MSRRRRVLLSLVVPALFLVFGLATLSDYGETWDEQFDQDIGRFYVHDWAAKGVPGLESRFIPLQRNYAPAFDILVVKSHDLLFGKLKLVRDEVASYHVPSLLAACFTLWLTFWFGARLWGEGAGLLAAVCLALMPQVIGHAQNNLKDTPMMACFIAAIYVFWRAVESGRWSLYALAGVAVGVTYGVKVNAVLIPVIVVGWRVLAGPWDVKSLKRFAGGLLVSGALAIATIPLVWPYYRFQPIARFRETFATFRKHEFNEYVLYLGRHFKAREVPWHFPFVMLGVTTPIVVLVLLFAAVVIGARRFLANKRSASPFILLTLWIAVPPVVQAVSGAPMYDGARHYLTVLPPIALLAGFAGWRIGEKVRALPHPRGRAFAAAYGAALGCALAALLATDIRMHPYQVVFFNRLTGGIRGAESRFDLDYWGQSLKEAGRWLDANAPPGSRVWTVGGTQHFMHVDSGRLLLGDQRRRPDYKVSLRRGMLKTMDTEWDYQNPPRPPVHAVRVDGVDLVQIFDYPVNRRIAEGEGIAPSSGIDTMEPGLRMTTFWNTEFKLPSANTTIVPAPGFPCPAKDYADRQVSIRYDGVLRVEAADLYTFRIESDDDALLQLEGKNVMVNPSVRTTEKSVRLEAGSYRMRLDWENDVGPGCLKVWWRPGERKDFSEIPPAALGHLADQIH